MKPFKKARLYDAGENLNERWFVEFYVWNDQKNKLVRKKDYEINEFKTLAERKAFANKRIQQINSLLKDGHIIREAQAEEPKPIEKQRMEIKAGFEKILEIKAPELRPKSIQRYKIVVKTFFEAVHEKKYLDEITKQDIFDFSDYQMTKLKIAPITRNDRMRALKAMLDIAVLREWIPSNPALDIKMLKEKRSMQNRAYTPEQRAALKSVMDAELALTVQFMYYCFMRTNETRLLKIEQLDMNKKQLYIPAEISKNGKAAHITIPPLLYEELEKLNLAQYPPNYYLFGRKSEHEPKDTVTPNEKPYSFNRMSERHRQVLKKLQLDKQEYTLYSWKHTGVVEAYNAKIDIKSIQRQCRHHSLEMTDNYLKSLGLSNDENVFMKMPKW